MKIKKSPEKEHSKYGASGSKRWMGCVGSTAMSEGMESYDNPNSIGGTKAHACLEFLFKNRKNLKAAVKMAADTWDADQIKHANETVKYVEELLWYWKVADRPDALHIETKINSSAFTMPGQSSTLDIAIDAFEHRTLVVADYKYGVGIVDVENNSQLIYYALGMLLKLGWKKYDRVVLIIIQPRGIHNSGETNRVWETTAENIINWGRKFKAAVKLAEAPGAIKNLTYDEDHCRYCLARIKCPKIKEEAFKQAQIDFSPTTNLIKKIPDVKKVDDIGKLLDACGKLQMFINAVKEKAYNDAKRGKKVNGYKLVEKRSIRKWKNETEISLEIKGMGLKAFSDPKILSPAQFEKKFCKNKSSKDWLGKRVTNTTGGTTLARIDSKKKEINIFEAEFSAIE